tara:strand:+ start:432 stop:551 length:120 start_codon:yes stop_codon:yes gene_type:complete
VWQNNANLSLFPVHHGGFFAATAEMQSFPWEKEREENTQ